MLGWLWEVYQERCTTYLQLLVHKFSVVLCYFSAKKLTHVHCLNLAYHCFIAFVKNTHRSRLHTTSTVDSLQTYKHNLRLRLHQHLPHLHDYVPHIKAFGKYLTLNHLHKCECAMYLTVATIRGRCLFCSEFILLRVSNCVATILGWPLSYRAATIWEWHLFEGGIYLRVASIWGWHLFEAFFHPYSLSLLASSSFLCDACVLARAMAQPASTHSWGMVLCHELDMG